MHKSFKSIAVLLILAAVACLYFFVIGGKSGDSSASDTGIKDDTAVVSFVVGDVKIIYQGQIHDALPDEEIKSGMTVKTGLSSMAVLKIGNTGNMKIHPDTEFVFNKINDNGNTSINLKGGAVYSKLKKLAKDQSYEVKTMIFTAAVRGTEFLTVSNQQDSGIKVLEGKVSVKASKSTENIAEAGSGINVTPDGKSSMYSLNENEILFLEKDSAEASIEPYLGRNRSEVDAINIDLREKIEDIDKKIAKNETDKNMSPLDRLRNQGKPLTMISMLDGSQIAGAVVKSDDKNVYLDTGEGVVKLPVDEILRRKPMK